MRLTLLTHVLFVAYAAGFGHPSSRQALLTEDSCKCFPGDSCWPVESEWNRLNATLGGRLIATVPLGNACHGESYDEKECDRLREEWRFSAVHVKSSSSVMAPLFANQSCDPFQPRDSPCELGNYVVYAVDASGPEDIIAALKFAEENSIRFVIRNTGHDYHGRSTGAGALSVWTHHLKDIEIIDWDDVGYTGKALKLGAGVQGFEAIEVARHEGLTVVTGECPTVGLAGGYTQGGGHSALSSSFGLAADNTLSFDVVTPSGELITASKSENQDLYWALSGGGGGVFGVVVSMVVQAHPDAKVGGASFAVPIPANQSGLLYDVIDTFHEALPDIVDAGVMVIYFFGPGFFQVAAMTAYGKTREETEQILRPFSHSLVALGINLDVAYTEYESYADHYDHYWGPLPSGNIQVGTDLFGGRLLPRSVLPNFSSTARQLVELGVVFIGVGLNVSPFGKNNANAVLPQWRNSIVQVSLTLPWDFEAPFEEMVALQDRITNEVQPVIEAATPGAGAYMNEADFQQPDWQETFFGENYPELLRIKEKFDPQGLLYAVAGVGSESWKVDYHGRMCRSFTCERRRV